MLSFARRLRCVRVATAVALCTIALAASLPGQVSVLSSLSFTNETGGARDGLVMSFSQPLAANQPSLVPGGGNVIPPFTLPAGYPDGSTVVLNGQTVGAGDRVPTNGTMTFVGTVGDAEVTLTQAAWTVAGVATNTVAQIEFVNMTQTFANRISFTAVDATGAIIPIQDVRAAETYEPSVCMPTSITGAPGGTVTVDVPCCVSGFGGTIGPLQVTFQTEAPIGEIRYRLQQNTAKTGSALEKVAMNEAQEESVGSQSAGAVSIETNLVVDAVFPPHLAPFTLMSGLRSRGLYACGGFVAPGTTLVAGRVVLTSMDTGPLDIGTANTGVLWYPAAPRFGAVPDALYFNFDALIGNSGVANLASPGVGADPAPLVGHSLVATQGQFGGALQGAGMTTGSSLDTGWVPNLGLDDFSVSFWLDRNGNQDSVVAVFGDSGSLRCLVRSSDLELRLSSPAGPQFVTLLGVLPPSGGKTFTFVRDGANAVVNAYMDGSLVTAQTVTPVSINGPQSLTIGAASNLPPFGGGMLLDEFRFYRRMLSAGEVFSTHNKQLPLPHSGSIAVAQWQSNSSLARFEADGEGGRPGQPVILTRCVGETVMISMSSENHGMGWELTTASGLPSVQPRSVLGLAVGHEPINIDIFDPATVPINGYLFQSTFSNAVIPLSPSVATDIHAQLAIATPTLPLGIATSAAGTIQFTDSGSQEVVLGPNSDDGFIEIFPGVQPLCGPAFVTFAGTGYSSLFVNANGSVSFGAPSTDASPSPSEFALGPPRLAGLWTDLNPSVGGTIVTQVLGGAVRVRFDHVSHGVAAMASSFDLVLGPNGGASIFGYQPASGGGASLVGLTPGGNATDPGSVTFSSLVGAGLQTSGPSDMVYEFVASGPPTGFYSIRFPNADGSVFIVE